MKILICPDSFKGTLSSREAADAIELGVRTVIPDAEIIKLEIGDGGEGTVGALVRNLRQKGYSFQRIDCRVSDPLGREITASYYVEGSRAYIEVASAGGLTLIQASERDVMKADSKGTGQLIVDAYGRGCREFVITLGGSATCDGGKGIYEELQALQSRVWGERSGVLLPDCRFRLLCDVRNPMCGPQGAAAVFAPQKGASAEQVIILEKRLLELSGLFRRHRNIDVADAEFGGAAGGISGMLLACCNAEAVDGIDYMLSTIDFPNMLQGCDLVITGEGCLDTTTLHGKAVSGIYKACRERNVPLGVIAGRVNLPTLALSESIVVEEATPRGLSLSESHPWASFVAEASRRLIGSKELSLRYEEG